MADGNYDYHDEARYDTPATSTKRKKGSKKKPKTSRHIELMEWLPTLPQFFAYMGVTQFLVMFWVFIAEAANDSGETWHLVMMWLTMLVITVIFSIYMFLKIKRKSIPKTITVVLFCVIAFIFWHEHPIHNSLPNSHKERAVLYFVRLLLIALIIFIYLVAYNLDVCPWKTKEDEEESPPSLYENKEAGRDDDVEAEGAPPPPPPPED